MKWDVKHDRAKRNQSAVTVKRLDGLRVYCKQR